MVPFYGQGMNCGMEDCLVLDDFLDKHDNNLAEALRAFSAHRSVDAKAMCDLGKKISRPFFVLFFISPSFLSFFSIRLFGYFSFSMSLCLWQWVNLSHSKVFS